MPFPKRTTKTNARETPGKGGREMRRPLRRKSCKFCGDKVEKVDFKDTERLLKFTSERGKILPRRVSGMCAHHQRELARAIKRARGVALMPYLAE